MAIAVGSRVALKVGGIDLALGQVTAQPPVFGVSETAGGGPYVIDWENGNQHTVPLGVLDELVEADPTTRSLLGQVVNIAGFSSAYTGVVVAVYSRNGATQCVLVKTLQNDTFVEYDATTVVPQTNL